MVVKVDCFVVYTSLLLKYARLTVMFCELQWKQLK